MRLEVEGCSATHRMSINVNGLNNMSLSPLTGWFDARTAPDQRLVRLMYRLFMTLQEITGFRPLLVCLSVSSRTAFEKMDAASA